MISVVICLLEFCHYLCMKACCDPTIGTFTFFGDNISFQKWSWMLFLNVRISTHYWTAWDRILHTNKHVYLYNNYTVAHNNHIMFIWSEIWHVYFRHNHKNIYCFGTKIIKTKTVIYNPTQKNKSDDITELIII